MKEENTNELQISTLSCKMVEAYGMLMANGKPSMQCEQSNEVSSYMEGMQPVTMNFNAANSVSGYSRGGNAVKPSPMPAAERYLGKFGWVTIGKCHIPFIIRYGEKYISLRILKLKLFNRYPHFLQSEVYSCAYLRTYNVSPSEACLLNEINIEHCDGQFGREPFTPEDFIMRVHDAVEFYNFFNFCYVKLCRTSNDETNRCGFICINGDSVVPYTARNNEKYVPLFYFEGETDNLQLKAICLEGWELSYLKFCCKIQGICNDLFSSETCHVISLKDIKSYFSPNTVFKEYWPNSLVGASLPW